MGRFFTLVSLVLLSVLVGCKQQGNQTTTKDSLAINANDSLQNKVDMVYITENDYIDLKLQSVRIKPDTTEEISKINNKLVLPLNNNKEKVFCDTLSNTENPKMLEYIYKGFIGQINMYVVLEKSFAKGEYILIDKATGIETKIWDEPMPSPDNRYVATCSSALGTQIEPNGIQIWKLDNYKLRLFQQIKTDQWEPASLQWIDSKTLIFVQNIPETVSSSKKKEIKYAKLILK